MSRHADALGVLRGWGAPDPGQEALRERYVAHLEAHPDGTERGCRPDHLTAGTLVLAESGDHVLLNLHRKAGRWFHFGGHCEPVDATLAATARREAEEESGLTAAAGLRFLAEPLRLDEHEVAFCDPDAMVRHLDVRYGALAPLAARPDVSGESLDVRWWPLDGLPDLEDEMHALIAAARARLLPDR